jgi:hypothetical protein
MKQLLVAAAVGLALWVSLQPARLYYHEAWISFTSLPFLLSYFFLVILLPLYLNRFPGLRNFGLLLLSLAALLMAGTSLHFIWYTSLCIFSDTLCLGGENFEDSGGFEYSFGLFLSKIILIIAVSTLAFSALLGWVTWRGYKNSAKTVKIQDGDAGR